MKNTRTFGAVALIAAAGLAATATTASADNVLFSFGFTELSGSYDSGAGVFSANAVDNDLLSTTGDVTRLSGGTATAEYQTGFVSAPNSADVNISIGVSNISGLTADGVGSFEVVDANGDKILGDIVGQWLSPGAGFLFFNGVLENVILQDNETPDGIFDGPSSGNFSMDFAPAKAPFNGAIVQLLMESDGGFFDNDFDGETTQMAAEVLPTPGSAALVALGLAGCTRRRR